MLHSPRPAVPCPRLAVARRPARCRLLPLAALATLLLAVPVTAQQAAPADQEKAGPSARPELAVHVFQLRHQPVAEALALVLPLLSPHGSVEVRQAANTLVVRDQLAALAKIVPVLRSFDHEARPLDVTISILEARPRDTVSPATPPAGSATGVLARLRAHLPYEHYELVAESHTAGTEGETVGFDLSSGWQIRFRLGTVLGERRVRLSQFEMSRQRLGIWKPLLRSNLNVWLGKPHVLVLTADAESPNALVVVVECRLAAAPVKP